MSNQHYFKDDPIERHLYKEQYSSRKDTNNTDEIKMIADGSFEKEYDRVIPKNIKNIGPQALKDFKELYMTY